MGLNRQEFWKEIENINNTSTVFPKRVWDAKGTAAIVDVWKKHYSELFNCLKKEKNGNMNVGLSVSECGDTSRVCPDEVENSIRNLQKNKSCGSDGIFAEHLMYTDKKLVTLLYQCFSCMLIHGVLPESLIDVILVPVIKGKSNKISCKDSYRPVALANIMSKVQENIVLNRIRDSVATKPNQFGFKRQHSTDMCIFL